MKGRRLGKAQQQQGRRPEDHEGMINKQSKKCEGVQYLVSICDGVTLKSWSWQAQ